MNAQAADFWVRAVQAFHTAKRELREDPDASASRSYYAAFYAVSALFALEGESFIKHTAVQTAVHRDLVKSGRWRAELGEDYSYLVETRVTGDYGGGDHVEVQDAQKSLSAAKEILNAVSKGNPKEFPMRG